MASTTATVTVKVDIAGATKTAMELFKVSGQLLALMPDGKAKQKWTRRVQKLADRLALSAEMSPSVASSKP